MSTALPGLALPGLWTTSPLPDGVLHRSFPDDVEVVLRGWLAAGPDQDAVEARVLEGLGRTRTRWSLESTGQLGGRTVRVVAGQTPEEGHMALALVRLPAAVLSVSRHEPDPPPHAPAEDPTQGVAHRLLRDLTHLDTSILEARAASAEALLDRPVSPERLVPWVLDARVSAGLTRGAVRLDNGLHVVPAEVTGPAVRLLAPDHAFWRDWSPTAAMTRAVLNLAGQLAAGTVPLQSWVLSGGATYLVVGAHPAAQGALLLPDLRALARGVFGDLEVDAIIADRDRLLLVPRDWPPHWRDEALGQGVRRAADLALPGPLWRP